MKSKAQKVISVILLIGLFIGSILVVIKMIFSGYVADDSYHVIMSYRNAMGDRLLMEMWEPHQTSAFLCAFLIKIYVSLTKSTTYLIVFLRICGLIFHGIVAGVIYTSFKSLLGKLDTAIISFIFFACFPKLSSIPEFSNMVVWFLTLSLCFLWKAYDSNWKKVSYTIISATFLALTIITYPTCMVVCLSFLIFFISQKDNRTKKSIGIYALTLVTEGIIYLIIVLWGKPLSSVIDNIRNIISGDESHSGLNVYGVPKGPYLLKEAGLYLGIALLVCALTYLIASVVKYISKVDKTRKLFIWHLGSTAITIAIMLYYVFIKDTGFDCLKLFFILIPIEALLCFCMDKSKEATREKVFLSTAIVSGLLVIVSVTILTNLSLSNNIPWLQVALIFGLIAFDYKFNREGIKFYYIFLVVFAVISMIVTCFTQKTGATGNNIFRFNSIVSSGPAKGVIVDWLVAEDYRVSEESINEVMIEGDKVMIISDDIIVSPSELYMVKHVEISQYSTICTPSYGEKYIDYFNEFPEKIPNIIIIDNNTKDYSENTFIFSYLMSKYDYECVKIDGGYTYYRNENN